MESRHRQVLSGARVPRSAASGGSPRRSRRSAQAAQVAKAGRFVPSLAWSRARSDRSCLGNVINTEPRDMYLSRIVAIDAGVPDTVPAMNVNRLCGSGAQAVVSAAHALAGRGCRLRAAAGGAEIMSAPPTR